MVRLSYSKVMSENALGLAEESIEERKRKVIEFMRKKTLAAYSVLLLIVVWIASYIRTRNLYGLRDITTGQWTLGPDLDPFLFLRWAKYIVANGSLMTHDMMRYVPLGFDTSAELKLVPYAIAWFHKFINAFGDYTIEYSAVIMPVFVFALTIIAFFFFVREVFKDRFESKHIPNLIALASSFFLAVIPSILPRTIAGIPEKEGLGFLFMFLSFYLFIKAWKAEKTKSYVIFGILSGISTALMSHTWGGSIYVYLGISLSVLFSFGLGSIKKRHFYTYALWLISSMLFLMPFTNRYSLGDLFASTSTGLSFAVLGFLIADFILYETKFGERIREKYSTSKMPRQVVSIAVAIVLSVVLMSVFFGPSFVWNSVKGTANSLIYPYSDRLSFTVAENRQPFFIDEWRGSFGPIVGGLPLFFWLFFVGSIYLFNDMINHLHKKDRWKLVGAYAIFLFALIFSKYSGSSVLNGTSGTSRLVYFGGILLLVAVFGYTAWSYFKRREVELLRNIDFSQMLIFAFFFISIVGSRSAIRLMMVLGLPAAIIASYFTITLLSKALSKRKESTKIIWFLVAGIVLIAGIYTAYNYSLSRYYQAGGFIPNSYTQQWQKAMAWVRENTTSDAVFSHWWDYGYWVQSIGERATIADGGNEWPYWDHLIGRHVLTNPSKKGALEYLYTLNVTHLLIDSTDIGKYSAFSNIGSDENYDRASYIPTMGMDLRATQETSNGTTYFYKAGFGLDEDIIYENKEGNKSQKIFLPAGRAGLGGVLLTTTNTSISRPEGIFIDQGIQYKIPLRYVYFNNKLYDFKSGIEAGMFIIPLASQSGNGVSINPLGTALYLSKKVVNGNLARLYLFGEEGEGFNLVHSEDDFIVASLKSQGSDIEDFVYFDGLRGPIKIWEVDYSAYPDIEAKPEYLETAYPRKELYVVNR